MNIQKWSELAALKTSILIERINKNLVNWNILVARGDENNNDSISSGERNWNYGNGLPPTRQKFETDVLHHLPVKWQYVMAVHYKRKPQNRVIAPLDAHKKMS